MKKGFKRALAFMLMLVMCVSITGKSAYAEEVGVTNEESEKNGWDGVTTVSKYTGENFNVMFSLTNYWEGGYNANVKIENTGSSAIENWYLSFALDNNLSTIWNAEVVSNEAGQYVVKNTGQNADIPVGGCVEFGISVNETFAGFPKEYRLLGESAQVQKEAYSVEYILDSDWGTGFTARVLLTNHTEEVLEDWVLEFDFDREITNIWNGVIEKHEGNHYVIKNAGHNANMAAGETISFGFNGEGGTKEIEPYNCSLFTICEMEDCDDEDDKEIIDIYGGITWDEMQDTDSDGLPDIFEKDNRIDPENPDTDGDGLSDGFEVMKASSDPLKKCTLENGIVDAELDPDEDGLTLLEEQMNNTDPLMADTDDDGLIDGDEVNRFKTNPLLFDSDKDGVGDGVEIEIGLEPLNPKTHGYSDADYRYEIKVDSASEKLKRINNANKEYIMDMEIVGTGDVYSELLVRESAYSYSLASDFSLGIMPEIIYSGEGSVESVKVSFEISDENIYETFSAEDLRGIKRYSIFYLDEENSVVIPLSTDIDEENNVITATSSKVGTFIVLDMEKWFASLGYEMVDGYSGSETEDSMTLLYNLRGSLFDSSAVADDKDESIAMSQNEMEELITASACLQSDDVNIVMDVESTKERSVFSLNRAINTERGSNIPETIEPGVTPVDVVFCINNSVDPISDAEFESIKENIQVIGKTLFQNCNSVRIYIIDQNGNIIETEHGSVYAAYEKGLTYIIEKVKNTPSQEPNIGKQLQRLIGDIEFRQDAYCAIVFFGNSYLPSYQVEIRQSIVGKGAKCIIDCPATQSGSWYDKLSKESNGMLLYSYLDFSDDIIEFMFGDAVIKELTTYNMVSSMGLKKIVLKEQLNRHSNVDTDGDSLSDWSEIREDRITVNPGGGAVLPTYYEYLIEYDGVELYRWMAQYLNLRDKNGKYIGDILDEILVLPVFSDPTMKDSDGDNILDNIEITQKIVDERYKCMNPFHTDTIETIYPELSDTRINNPSYPSYITVNGNDVVVHLKVVFEGDTDEKATSVLYTDVTDVNVVNEICNITSRIGEDPTLKELVIDGIESRWNSSFEGTEYDFCEGLSVDFSIDITEEQEELFKNKIYVTIKSGVCGYCYMDGVDKWKTRGNRFITLNTSDCREASHEGKNGKLCKRYKEVLSSMASYEGAAAHEMGHAMGVKDLYPDARYNHGYTIISNSEIVYSSSADIPSAGAIMMNCGRGTENDIEMIILAFSENKWQYYVPYGKQQKMSKAIKSFVRFENKNTPGVVYRWDEESSSFKEE